MSHQIVVDAGPALNFFATNQQRLLFKTLGPVTAPDTVVTEICAKSARDTRFRAAAAVLRKLPSRLFTILSDAETPELAGAVQRICNAPMAQRKQAPRDLGETMVVAHAVVAAESGCDVFVLIDDGGGAKMAAIEPRRLDRLRANGKPYGVLRTIGTCTVLEKAASAGHITNRADMRSCYQRMRDCDDGLIAIKQTELLSRKFWP